jgi:hypothetical protein
MASVVLIAFFFVGALLVLGGSWSPPQPASIVAGRVPRPASPRATGPAVEQWSFATAMSGGGSSRRARNPLGWRDRGPQPAVTGRGAYPRWWHRVRSLVGLAVVCGFTGLVLAASIGAVAFLAGFLLELAIT